MIVDYERLMTVLQIPQEKWEKLFVDLVNNKVKIDFKFNWDGTFTTNLYNCDNQYMSERLKEIKNG